MFWILDYSMVMWVGFVWICAIDFGFWVLVLFVWVVRCYFQSFVWFEFVCWFSGFVGCGDFGVCLQWGF